MSLDAQRPFGTSPYDPIYLLPDGSFGTQPITLVPIVPQRVPGQGATSQDMIGALAQRGITGVSHQTAFFLLQVYGGQDPRALGVTTDEVIAGMLTDGSLTNAGGITTQLRLDFSAIDSKKIAAAIFREAGIDPDNPGLVLNPHLLDFGIDILTGNPNAHSEAQAEMQIRKFGPILINGGGGITVDQLAEMIKSGELAFSPADGQPFIGVTSRTDRQRYGLEGREAPYLLSFDTNVDGGLDWQELQTALQSNPYENQVVDPKMAAMLWNFYGTSVNGVWVVTADGIEAMKAEGVLKDWANSDGTAGFAIHLAAINPDRFAQGLMRADADGNGGLDPEEMGVALGPYLDAGSSADFETMLRLGSLYGGRTWPGADAIKQMLADGVLVPAVGPAGAETAGYRINLDAIPTERIVDRMFTFLGKDPATGTMTGAEFESALAYATGDASQVNGDIANYIASMRGSPDGAGGFTLNRDQVLSVFTSGAITRGPAGTGSILPIQNHVNHQVPPHHHHHWWDSVFKFVGDEVKDVVSTISDIVQIEETAIADIFNGKLSLAEALEKGGGQIIGELKAAIDRGDQRAKDLMGTLGTALRTGLQDLSDGAHKLVDELVTAATELGDEVAIKTLMTLGGMTPEQARDALHAMAKKVALIDSASGLTHGDIKEMIPDYDATVAELEAIADDFMGGAANDPAARRRLLDAGYSFDSNGNLMQGAQTLSVEDKRDVFAKHWRADAAVEINFGHAKGASFNGLQGRIFLCYTGRDENGNKSFQLRFRVLDEAGVAGGPDAINADAGFISVHDLVLQWSVLPGGTVEMGDVKWNSTFGVIGEFSIGGGIADEIKDLFDFPIEPVAPVPTPRWNANLIDSEIGGGWGMTVSYNLTKMEDKFLPFAAELFGLAGGAALAGAGIGILGWAQPELDTFIAKWGATAVNLGAMIGSFGVDLLYALGDKHDDQVSVSHGGFFWAAVPRVGFPKWQIGDPADPAGSAQLRARFQINWGSTPKTMY